MPWATSPLRDNLLPWWLWAVLASLEHQWELIAPFHTVKSICPASALLGNCVPTSRGCLLIPPRHLSHPRAHCYSACTDLQSCWFGLFHFPGKSGQMDTGVVQDCGFSHAAPDSCHLAFLPGAAALVTLTTVFYSIP